MNEIEFKLALHARLCGVADLIMAYHGPCNIQGGRCLKGDPNPCCIRTRFKRLDPGDRRCTFIGEEGCEFDNIECKVWFCDLAKETIPLECRDAMYSLQSIAESYRLTNG